jgi:glycosyltransferase involved in cell wall biosynthesis
MSFISIITASQLNLGFLKILFKSLQEQNFKNFEVIICLTNPPADYQKQLHSFAPDLDLRFVATPKSNIASARNRGLEMAEGDVVLFLDEDCFLPRPTYLEELAQFHSEHPQLAVGGLYLNKTSATTSDQFYNFVCNTWVKSRQNLKGSPPVLLGGCCFYPLRPLKKHKVLFDEQNAKAGEEYLLNSRWTELGFPLLLSARWSVFHNPETSFYKVFKKSWVQGSQIEPRKAFFQLEQAKTACKFFFTEKDAKWIYLPMMGLYGTIGRASFLKNFVWLHYNLYTHQKHKKRASQPFGVQSEKTVLLAPAPASKKHKQPNRRKEVQKLISQTGTNLLRTSVKIKREETLYKN